MKQIGWNTQIDMLIDIVGDKLVNGRYIIKELEMRGLRFDSIPGRESNQELINHFFNQMRGIDKVLRFDPDVFEVSSNMHQNDYCLTVERLREYKLNKIGI